MYRCSSLVLCLASLCLILPGCGGESEEKLVASAQTYLDKKDPKSAVIQLKSALQKNAKSGQARFLLGKALRESGDPVSALVELRKAQELGVSDDQLLPEMARTMLMVGDHAKVVGQFASTELQDPKAMADLATTVATALAAEGDKTKALEVSSKALQSVPGYAPAIILQAQLKASDRDPDGALFLLDDVLAKDPNNERAGLMRADLLRYAKQDAAGALAAFNKVLASNPASVAARSSIIGLLAEQGKADEAKTQLAELKKVAPNHPETLYLEARDTFQNKDYKTTRDITARLLKALPNSPRVLELAGATEYRLKSDVQAEALLGRAMKVAPGNVRVRHLLAQVYLRSGQPNKAVDVLQPVIDSPQADGISLALTGEAYLQSGDVKRSDDAFNRAAKLAPQDPRVRTSVAMAQMAHGGNVGAAMTELETVAAEDKSPRADLALITGRLRQNDVAGALKAVDTLQKKLPDSPLPDHLRGRILMLKKDMAGATTAFNAALAKDANYFPSSASLAAIDLAAGKPELAKARFDELLKRDPKNYRALLALAELNNRTGGSPAEVTRLVTAAVKAGPGEPSPRLLLVENLLRGGDAKAALVAAQDATAALPNNLEIMDALGRAQLAAGNSQQAVSTFKKLAGLQPNKPLNELRLADAYMATQDSDSAAGALRRALGLDPRLIAARRGLVTLALMDKKPDQALSLAREAQQLEPKNGAGFALEGEVEASRKGWAASATAYRAALQRTKSTETAIKLHQVLVAGNQRPEADKLAASWLRDNPKDPAFRYYLGDAALAQNDFPGAEVQYRAVVELQPGNALALNNIAWLMVKQNKPGAVAVAEKANTIVPNRAPLLDTLATALAADNQLPKAIETQKKALDLEPKDPGIRLNLARLYIKAADKPAARTELLELAKLGDKFRGQAEVADLLKTVQ
jgi:putative PEP-CTERM system TPR-repeat lipoprotein